MNGQRLIGPIFLEKTVNAQRYTQFMLHPFFNELSEDKKLYSYFMQDNATAHTAHESMTAIQHVFDDRVISCGLWPARLPDLNPSDFYLWSTLKSKVYANNRH